MSKNITLILIWSAKTQVLENEAPSQRNTNNWIMTG